MSSKPSLGNGPASGAGLFIAWLDALWRADVLAARELSSDSIELSWPGGVARGLVSLPPSPWSGAPASPRRVVRTGAVFIAECQHSVQSGARSVTPPFVVAMVAEEGHVVAASWHSTFEAGVQWAAERSKHSPRR